MNPTVLDVTNLKTEFINDKKAFPIIKDVNFKLERGKVLGIVGESGCGKSVTVNTVLNLLPKAIVAKQRVNCLIRENFSLLVKLSILLPIISLAFNEL